MADLQGVFLASAEDSWERGSGDCGLYRASDSAILAFVVRKGLGVMLIYEDRNTGNQMVLASEHAPSQESSIFVGGQAMRVPRRWFCSIETAFEAFEAFLGGRALLTHGSWEDFLLGT